MHYEIRSQDASSSDPPTKGSSGDRDGYRQRSRASYGLARGESRRPKRASAREEGRHCHSDQSAKTALASQVRQRTGRGRTAAADTATSWDPGSYPLRDP